MSQLFNRNCRIFFLLLPLFFLSHTCLYAQVDMTRHASDNLFEVKPIVSSESIQENELMSKEDEVTSLIELEVQKGLDYWQQGEMDDALYHFEQLAEEYVDIPQFYFYIGQINFEKKEWEASKIAFQKTLSIEPLFMEAKYMMGMIALEQEDIKQSKELFKQLVDIPVYAHLGNHGIGLIQLYQGNLYGAGRSFENSIDSDSTFLEAYIPLTRINLALSRVNRARKTIEKALTVDPDWQQGLMIRGMLSVYQSNDLDQFKSDMNRLMELDPQNGHYLLLNGLLEVELEHYTAAIDLFRKAYNINIDSVRRGAYKISSKYKMDQPVQRSLNYIQDHMPKDTSAARNIERGICELVMENKSNAISYFKAANNWESSSAAYLFLGVIARSNYTTTRETIKYFDESIALDSNNWIAYEYRAEKHMAMGKRDSAFSDYTKVIELKPYSKEALKNRGTILLKSGYYLDAYRDFAKALGIDPTDTDVFYNRALAAFEMKQIQMAIADLSQCINLKPNDGEAYYLMSRSYMALGDTSKAIFQLDSASKYSKYKDEYHQELLDLAKQHQMHDQCLSAYNRLVKYNSPFKSYRLDRARFYMQRGMFEDAVKDLNYHLERNKKSGETCFLLGECYKKLGDQDNSAKFFRKAERLEYKVTDDSFSGDWEPLTKP